MSFLKELFQELFFFLAIIGVILFSGKKWRIFEKETFNYR